MEGGQIKQHKPKYITMKTLLNSLKSVVISSIASASLIGIIQPARAQLPADFPGLTVTPNTNPAPGYLFGSVNAGGAAGKSNYFAILDNNLNPILLSKTNSLGTLTLNGLFKASTTVNGAVGYQLKDESFNVVDTYIGGNGYPEDNHDFEILPNGHAIIECSDNTPVIDMSKLVTNGFPAATPTEFIIQEVDQDHNVVFEWNSLDHIPVTDSLQTLTNANLGDYIHINSVWFDDTDGNLILSCRNTSEVIKISRVTGDVIWQMGAGIKNQFTFSNGIAGNADSPVFWVQHNARRLPNGRFTVFDNGYSQHSDPKWNVTRPYTRGAQYVIDETNKTATLVWEFRHTPDIIDYNGGTYQWLPDGHGIIQWGGANGTATNNAMSEADENGNLVADAVVDFPGSGNLTRQLWPLESTYVANTQRELSSPNSYIFTDGGTNNTGVTLNLTSIDGQEYSGDDYNSVTVSKQPFAPVLPRFSGKAPRLLPIRVEISGTTISSITSDISFDAGVFGFNDPNNLAITSPANLTVYYRPTPGQGVFQPLPTDYNSVTHQVESSITGFGEFVFGFPDLAEVPYPPLLKYPAPGATVNQNLPVAFLWTPQGFAQSYYLQVSTSADFSTLLVDAPGLKTTRYTNAVSAGQQYYWRVQTTNYGGTSDWVTNTFTTVPPSVQVTVPGGGEAWVRGNSYILQWKDNLAENVVLDLYKGTTRIQNIVTNSPAVPAYTWKTKSTLVPGSDYSIQIRSATNATLVASSATFSIVDQPNITATPASYSSDGQPQTFAFSAPGAASATVWGSTNLSIPNWQNLGSVSVTSSNGIFTNIPPYNFYRISLP